MHCNGKNGWKHYHDSNSQCAINTGLIQLSPYHFGSLMLVVVESQVASWRLLIESFHCNIIETF